MNPSALELWKGKVPFQTLALSELQSISKLVEAVTP